MIAMDEKAVAEIMELHRGGKLALKPTVELSDISQLRKIYTPGVAEVCMHIRENPEAARDYTMIGNTVCIATNGTAVLGLGHIGAVAGMPVMEGKSVILNKMAGVGCMPILIESLDADYIVEALTAIAPTFSAIMLEDISAPLCFEVEEKLQQRVSIPVFHDDQHGTATVVLSALIRALSLTGRSKESVRTVINGAGAAGTAITRLLSAYGFNDIVLCDRKGALYAGRSDLNPAKAAVAAETNPRGVKGVLADVLSGADVFIGVSGPGLVSTDMIRSMNKSSIVFALANPVPEIEPADALGAGAAIASDGKVVNNALVFPGLMRGALDARAAIITTRMKFKAAEVVAAQCVGDEIVPDFMDSSLHQKVARAVASAA
jgi:malate dehydrogenase (oxaloacetate-decarboxylating)